MNLFAYCDNNPVNSSDPDGHFKLPNWAKIAIGVTVIACLAVATVITGGAAAGIAGFILHGALQGAIVGAVSGAVIGATIGAVKHRVVSGSWKGSVKAAIDGAADGILYGAIAGGIAGGISSVVKVGQAANAWGSVAGKSSLQNMSSHYSKHVIEEGHKYLGKNIVQYTNNAKSFFSVNQNTMRLTSSGNYVIRAVFVGYKAGGFFSEVGKIFSFFNY